MNDKQRRFAEYYAQTANATKAAQSAGYSVRTARSQGQRLLTNADIQERIKELQTEASAERIATMTDIKAFWTEAMNDKEIKMADRIKASELLAKSAGAFLHIGKGGSEDDIIAYGEDSDGGDVIIYMPAKRSEEECQLPPESKEG